MIHGCGEQVFELLLELRKRRGTTTLLVTHNPSLARRCGKLLALESGVLHGLNEPNGGLEGERAQMRPVLQDADSESRD